MTSNQLRTRIAPTPSGFLHPGNAVSFILTWALAKTNGGTLMLRIDDLDTERLRHEYVQSIFDVIRMLGIEVDEGPKNSVELETLFSQRSRVPRYLNALQQLANGGHLYACTCSRTQLAGHVETGQPHVCRQGMTPLQTPGASWRLKVDEGRTVRFNEVGYGLRELRVDKLMPDPVVKKKDGIPAYQIASLCDDMDGRINLVVRGEDLLPSTAVQCLMAEMLGFDLFLKADFLHHSLITDPNGTKLSKSAGADPVKGLIRDKGVGAVYSMAAQHLGIASRSVYDRNSFLEAFSHEPRFSISRQSND